MEHVVVNIGCIECGVSSNIVGVFSDYYEAVDLANKLNRCASWREGGQNSYQVFLLPEMDTIKEEYRGYLKAAVGVET